MEPVVVAMSSAFAAVSGGERGAPPPRRKVEYASGRGGRAGPHRHQPRRARWLLRRDRRGDRRRGSRRRGQDERASCCSACMAPTSSRLHSRARRQGRRRQRCSASPIRRRKAAAGRSSVARARVSDALAIEPAPALGFDGAAVLDAQGRLAGIASLKLPWWRAPRRAAVRRPRSTPVEAIRDFLDAQKIAPDPAGVSGPDAAKASVVRVICVRR